MAWKTYGHQNTKRILELQLQAGRFAHAYLFNGPSGIGKKTLALEFAAKLLQTSDLKTHPDFSILEPSEEISVQNMREFISPLSLKPFVSRHKVAIIDNAELMNPQSSNALLKTLEEPNGNSVIILISATPQLLPTIISRCQSFFFNVFSKKQLEDFAKEKGLPADNDTISASFGRVDRLLQLSENGTVGQMEAIHNFENIQKLPAQQRLLSLSNYADLETPELASAVNLLGLWQKQKLVANIHGYKVLAALLEARKQLQTNKNKKLILQDLFLKI